MAGSGRSGPPRLLAPPSSSTSMGKTAPRVGLSGQLWCAVTKGPLPDIMASGVAPSAGMQGATIGVEAAMADAQAAAAGL